MGLLYETPGYNNWEQHDDDNVKHDGMLMSRGSAAAIPSEFEIGGWRHYHHLDREWYTYSDEVQLWLSDRMCWIGFWNRNGAARGVYLNQTNVPAGLNGKLWHTPAGFWIVEHVQAVCHTTTTAVLEIEVAGVTYATLDFDGSDEVAWEVGASPSAILPVRGIACLVSNSGPVSFPGGTVTVMMRSARP